MRWRAGLTVVVASVLLAAGAARAGAQKAPTFAGVPPEARVVLVPPNVQLSEVTTGGTVESRADWTAEAAGYVQAALAEELQKRRLAVVRYQAPTDGAAQRLHGQLALVHGLVAHVILRHRYNERLKLPSKGERFDWTLGPQAASLAGDSGATHALVTEFADAYASGGRVALNVAAALFGGPIAHGRQVAVASLVDLATGDIVWFNYAVGMTGDLRGDGPARQAVQRLLSELPQ